MSAPQAPLFNDPIFNGAADPTLIWNHLESQWWMVYTQRRATSPGPGVAGVHGSDLGIASSKDGHDWLYRGTIPGLEWEPGRNTWWAPEILFHEGRYHMYVSYVQGMPLDWNRPRTIIHYTSRDLWHWTLESFLPLDSERVIDSCIVRLPDGMWRMWYKDECDESFSHYADSPDLCDWTPNGRAIDHAHHEGANVFRMGDRWWYIGDYWRGMGTFSSDDCLNWTFEGMILEQPGTRTDDRSIGHHGDVVVQQAPDGSGEVGWIFYFTHPQRGADGQPLPFTSVQVARIRCEDGKLVCDRDVEAAFQLLPPE